MNTLLVLFAILNAMDAWTTWQGIRFGAKEAWLPKFVFERIGLYRGLLLLKVGIVVAMWYWQPFTFNQLAVVDAAYAALIVWNWIQLNKQKSRTRKD